MRYTCQQCREEVSVRPSDELSHLARARLAAHLDACSSCRSYALRYAATIDATRAWTPVLTEATKDAILDRLCPRREPVPSRPVPRWRAAAVWLGPAVALAAFALVRWGTEIARPPVAGDAAREDAPPLALSAAPAGQARAAPQAQIGPACGEELSPLAGATARTEGRGPVTAIGSRRVRRAVAPAAPAGPAPAPPAPSAEIAPLPVGDTPHSFRAESMYADAERALAEEHPAGAARILEELIERFPDTAGAQEARIELGRLYAGPLGHPSRAVIHLSAFVAGEQEPSARGAAKGLLCRLLSPAERNRVCWPGLVAFGEREER
jgi:hypothetical protein